MARAEYAKTMDDYTRKSFLERLQSADESRKRRWMIAGTVIIGVIVVCIWLAYFNNLIAGFSAPPQVAGEVGNLTLWQAIKNGTAAPYNFFVDKIRAFGEILSSPREYIINPPQ